MLILTVISHYGTKVHYERTQNQTKYCTMIRTAHETQEIATINSSFWFRPHVTAVLRRNWASYGMQKKNETGKAESSKFRIKM